jgi:hypothetical protein
MALMVFGVVVVAQDDGATLESVTADSESYLGQEVTLEGIVVEFVNARTFVLGEDAALDSDRVLVINNTDHELDLRIVREQQLRVTGTVVDSYENGGFGELAMRGVQPDHRMTTEMDDTNIPATNPEMQPTTDPAMAATPDTAVEAPTVDPATMDMSTDVDLSVMENFIQEYYANYTIIELTSVSNVEFVEESM